MSNGISTLGARIVATNLLKQSKRGKEGSESWESKVQKSGFSTRVNCVRDVLNECGGPGPAAAKALQLSYFTDVENETLAQWLTEEVASLKIDSSKTMKATLDEIRSANEQYLEELESEGVGNLEFDPPTYFC